MWKGNSQIRRPQEDKAILQQEMQFDMDSTTQKEYNLQNKDKQRAHFDISTNSPKCTKVGIHTRTQIDNGKRDWEVIREERSGSSQEWGERRQQGRELRGNESGETQQNNEEGEVCSANNMSTLSQENKSFLSCKKCGSDKVDSGLVLDCFFGAGTTGLVALKQNKNYIGIELNPEYIKIANKRLKPFLEQRKLK